ncbi:MAG: hypothetical protein V4481_05335 [Patescibacteria group bacterium]
MSQGFKLIADPSATVYRRYTIAGNQAYVIGDSVDVSRTTGGLVPSTSGSVDYAVRGVAMETVAATATSLLVALVTPMQLWSADSTNNSNATHNLQRMIFGADCRTVNNTGTDSTSASACLEQQGTIGAVGDKRIVVRFLAAANITA